MSDLSTKAYSRITELLDENSFVEIGGCVKARSTEFNLEEKKAPGDGVITGYGTIDERLVYVYSQDQSVLGGTIGEMHAKKISNLYLLAMKMGAPVIGILDSNGIRLEESFDALDGLGNIYSNLVKASGMIPTISLVFGEIGGGLSLISGMSDFTLASTDAKMYVNSPNTIESVCCDKDLSVSDMQSKCAGNFDVVSSESEIIAQTRTLISLLPSNNLDCACNEFNEDDLNRVCSDLQLGSDARTIATSIADNNEYFEIKSDFGEDLTAGFVRLGGVTVGVIGNVNDHLSTNGIRKAGDFVKFLDSYNIPLLSLTNTLGFKATDVEEKRLVRASSYLISTISNSTIPKVNVIIGTAFGSAYVLMNSKSIGADMVFAYEGSKIGMMDAKLASKIMYDGKGADVINENASKFDDLQNNIEVAASHGLVDTIIAPVDTRKYVIGAFEMLFTKSEMVLDKKHLSI